MTASTNVGRTRKKSVTRIRTVSIRPPTEARHDADQAADEDRDQGRQEPDGHRDPRPVDRLVEHVATQIVRPEEVVRRSAVPGTCPTRSSPSRAGRRTASGTSAMTTKTARIATPTTPSRRAWRTGARSRGRCAARRRQRSLRMSHVASSRRSYAHPRIEAAVDEVGAEIGHTTAIDGDEQEDPLQDRVVPVRQGVHGERAQARPVEDDLGRDRAGDDVAEVDRDRRSPSAAGRSGTRGRRGPWNSRRPFARAVVT